LATIIISRSDHGPSIPINVAGNERRLVTGEPMQVSLVEIDVLAAGGCVFERVWRSANVQLAALTLDTDEIDDDASPEDPVGELQGAIEDSSLELTDDAGGLFALDGLNIVVADTLAADTYAIEVTETNEEIENSPRVSTIEITVNEAA
jgi:hypothetical protein